MDDSTEVVVRGRCACGKRYRVRHAQAGTIVNCPNCSRTISITDADVRCASAGEQLIPLQPEQAEPAEAVLLDEVHLWPAIKGSDVGLTGSTTLGHGDAQLSDALQPGWRLRRTTKSRARGSLCEPATAESAPPVQRPFVDDALASFYLAGRRQNAFNLAVAAIMCALPAAFGLLLGLVPGLLGFIVSILMLVAQVVVLLYIVQFYWRTMRMTAEGEDEIPMVAPDWSLWDDAVLPFFWIIMITLVCGLPALAAWWYVPAALPQRMPIVYAGIVVGALLWPVAVMSVALGGTILYMRPDWLVRCVVGIGPVYLFAWMLVVAMAGALIALGRFRDEIVGYGPLVRLVYWPVSAFVNLYLGYVLFRTLGLLYRHFQRRFPWRI